MSAKMDSRFRGNDGGRGRDFVGENRTAARIGQRRKKNKKPPRNSRVPPRHSRVPPRHSRVPPRHSRESGNPFGAINFGISAPFFVKKQGEFAVLFLKMDSRFRGNDSGEARFCRRKWIPAFAGMTAGEAGIHRRKWIPAFAGMTAERRDFVGENRFPLSRE